jgi:hypothetical protein
LLKATGNGIIDFKPVSGLSHHSNSQARINILDARLNKDASKASKFSKISGIGASGLNSSSSGNLI